MERISNEKTYMAETILNCMDANIYVSDVQTGEVLFINASTKEDLALKSACSQA